MVARRRPTLPHLEMQYHGRWSVSRPSSGWDRVFQLRDRHQATEPKTCSCGDGDWLEWDECVKWGLVLRAVFGRGPNRIGE